MDTQYSVCLWFMDGQYDYDVRFVSMERAVERANQIAHSIGGKLGTTTRIIVTDGGDSIVWEWQYGQGITFPPDLAEQGV
jgi:hypothetical protein